MEWIEGFVESNGIRAHYLRTGGDQLPKMLLLHGLTGGPVNGFTIPLIAADAAGIIRAPGLGRAFVFGHSMGAITAAVLAADHPDCVRAVVLEDPPLLDAPPPGGAACLRASNAPPSC